MLYELSVDTGMVTETVKWSLPCLATVVEVALIYPNICGLDVRRVRPYKTASVASPPQRVCSVSASPVDHL